VDVISTYHKPYKGGRWDAQFGKVEDLHLVGSYAMEWNTYINNLNNVGLYFNCRGDGLRFFRRLEKGSPIVADRYRWLKTSNETPLERLWFSRIWNWNIPTNSILFS